MSTCRRLVKTSAIFIHLTPEGMQAVGDDRNKNGHLLFTGLPQLFEYIDHFSLHKNYRMFYAKNIYFMSTSYL